MKIEVIDRILCKAWGLNTQAYIFIEGMSSFEIYPGKWTWKTYDALDILCILNKEEKREYYIDVKNIYSIAIDIPEQSLEAKKPSIRGN